MRGTPDDPDAGAGEALAACPVCGLVFDWRAEGRRCPNRWCRRADRSFSVVFSVGTHQGALRHALLRYKYGGETWWAPAFARQVAAFLAEHCTWFEEFDLITSMPAYLGPGARRSWDHVGRVVADLAGLVGPAWEVVPGLVTKTCETPAMQGLSWADRQTVASGPLRRSLEVRLPEAAAGARIIVVDDVMTEGSSLREVARRLKLAGALEVAGLVIARPGWTAREGLPDRRREAPGR